MNSETDDHTQARADFEAAYKLVALYGSTEPNVSGSLINAVSQALATARSQGHRAGMEKAAGIAHDMGLVVPMWDRPGGPPGNGQQRPANQREIAAAILAAAEDTP